jgi:hypothetical protein
MELAIESGAANAESVGCLPNIVLVSSDAAENSVAFIRELPP